MITMVDVYDKNGRATYEAVKFLHELLAERTPEQSISHKVMPNYEQHAKFVNSCPYREWLIIEDEGALVGAIYITRLNEVGIAIKSNARRKRYATRAIHYLRNHFKPLPAVPSLRSGKFIANVAPGNEASRKLFEGLGGKLIQVTYQL